MTPAHGGTFDLALHGWTEPGERILAAAQAQEAAVALPRPGETLVPATAPAATRWWPQTRWQDASEAPILSSGLAAVEASASPSEDASPTP